MAEVHGSQFQRIWRPFIILTLLTIAEFAIAFTVEKGTFRNWTFIVMTILKAYYIVAFFMHLKFEKVNLIYTILVPLIFLVYLLVLMFQEGTYMFDVVFG